MYDEEAWVRAEIEAALSREILVIPLMIRGAFIPSKEQLPATLEKLTSMNGIRIRPDPDFQHDIDRLIKAIEIHISSQSG